ncbi:MAG TPA: C4-dicarboxylate transporter DctA, partial [Mycobacteriales bacterium]
MSTIADAPPETPPPSGHRGGILKQLWFWVLVAIVAGIVVGLAAPGFAKELKWLADAFIQLIK